MTLKKKDDKEYEFNQFHTSKEMFSHGAKGGFGGAMAPLG